MRFKTEVEPYNLEDWRINLGVPPFAIRERIF